MKKLLEIICDIIEWLKRRRMIRRERKRREMLRRLRERLK